MSDEPTTEASEGAEVLPLLPLRTIEWPGNSVEMKVVEPAHRQLYDDLLAAGARRIVAPLAGLPEPGKAPDPEAPPEGRRVHAIGAVLYLDELQEVSAQTGGLVKYVAKHSVEGLARISLVLNPSAFFKVNEQGARVEYMRAEVEVLEDDELRAWRAGLSSGVGASNLVAGSRLVEAWEDLRMLAERADEPRLQSDRLIRDSVQRSPTWQLADLWQRLQLSTQVHRERARIALEVREWIAVQQQEGRLPRQLPQQVDVTKLGMPPTLVEAFVKSQSPSGITLGDEFWEPLLRVLVADGPEARSELLLEMALEEVEVTRARAQLKEILG